MIKLIWTNIKNLKNKKKQNINFYSLELKEFEKHLTNLQDTISSLRNLVFDLHLFANYRANSIHAQDLNKNENVKKKKKKWKKRKNS